MFRPMLAENKNSPLSYPMFFRELQFPMMVSPKLDGIRNVVFKDCHSRTMKLLPSLLVQDEFSKYKYFDGELIDGDPKSPGVYNRTQSAVMTKFSDTPVNYFVFDYVDPDWIFKPFYERYEMLQKQVEMYDKSNLLLVQHDIIDNLPDLLEYENDILEQGYEGVIMRDPLGYYKQGRSTWKEKLLLKLKRCVDEEARILDIMEASENHNEEFSNELGLTARSSSKENKIPKGEAGTFIVDYKGQELRVGMGIFKSAERRVLWLNREKYVGKILKFRFFLYGIKDKPRQPRAIGFRDYIDM